MTPSRRLWLRRLLWLYFWLVILDGILRKWILPGLSNPLLLVRDPVSLIALYLGWPLLCKRRWWAWLQPLFAIGVIAFLLAISVGHGDLPTAAFGARILLLQLPIIFLYASLFDRNDVINFAWALAWLSIPMTFLIVVQSSLPAAHILNVAPGGEGSAAFSGALDRFRPAGVFSFPSGVSSFFTLSASALFLLLYGSRLPLRGRVFCLLVGIALVVALPVSISRALLAGYLQVLAAVIIALVLSRKRLMPVISSSLALIAAIGIGTTIPAFQQTSAAFSARWVNAAASESADDERLGGAVGVFETRVISGFTAPFRNLDAVPLLGYGIGYGTNVGTQRLTGERQFIVGEGGAESAMGELGLPLGLSYFSWRLAFSVSLLRSALYKATKGNPIPLILLGGCLLTVIAGPGGQPTALGFLVVSVGLTMASFNSFATQANARAEAPFDPALYN
jgi:hypothetical protein